MQTALLAFTCANPSVLSAQPSSVLLEAIEWYTGVAGRVDDARAKTLLLEAVKGDDPLARMWLARCHSRGRMGFVADLPKARALAAAEIATVEKLAGAGVLEAVFLMATAFDEGLGRTEDPASAAVWLRRAAERGHTLAQHNLGNAHSAGRGVDQSDGLAVEWWLKAAAAGDAIPQLRLGEAYEAGRGVTRDLAAARHWYGEAARRGNAAARNALERLSRPIALRRLGTVRRARRKHQKGPPSVDSAISLVEPYAPRSVRWLDLLTFDAWRLKLYGITYRGERPVQALVDAAVIAARQRLPRPAVTDDRYGVGFVGAHEGRGANFVFVDWWANEDELHHHAWLSSKEHPGRLRPTGADDLTACAWDLAVIGHERTAWVRHVLAREHGPDLDGYLADRLNGDV